MESPEAYIPVDRRHAIARGEALPERAPGAALFADISGFTALTETLARELGPHRGAEELTHHLNAVYDALIAELLYYGGSVVGFSGDAVTCWLAGDDGVRAAACGLAMQDAVKRIPPVTRAGGQTIRIGLKVGVAAGVAQRFLVGDPAIQVIDILAGSVVDAMADAEEVARTGEVVLAPATAAALAGRVATHERRGVTVAASVDDAVEAAPWPAHRPLSPDEVRPWLLPAVYDQLRTGRGEFLAELRPCTALFLHFGGIDYDADDAAAELDAFVRSAQHVLGRYEASVNDVTIGDKGSYLYCVFGAPQAHEDDAARAVAAALELRESAAASVAIGLAQGRMRTGAYGSAAARTYGALGDATNLSARLMQAAAAGQVVASRSVRQAAPGFTWEPLPDLAVKGKTGRVAVFSLVGAAVRGAKRVEAADASSPLVGRREELAQLAERLGGALAGEGQVVGVTAEAGVGKSRLVAELVAGAAHGLPLHAGGCHAYDASSSYLVWQSVWASLFGLPSADPDECVGHLAAELEAIDPALVPRLPLLGPVLGLQIADGDLTRSFDAKLRKASLESLLAECLRAKAERGPLLILLEDCHWIDPLSEDLLEVLARAIARLPVLLLMTYRPPDARRLRPVRVAGLPHFTELSLTELSGADSEQLIRARLAALCGPDGRPGPALVERVSTLAQGNPFYIEELLTYVATQGVDPGDQAAVAAVELPTSLQSLILSRIDRLQEKPRVALKIASVIGRVFDSVTLGGVARGFGGARMARSALGRLRALDFVAPEAEAEEVYAFRHVVTQEVAYEGLPFATRAMLHARVGRLLERAHAQVDLIAHHYGRSEDEAKKREYLLKAGEAAQAQYANEAAIDYFRRALPLLDDGEQVPVLLKLGKVLELTGASQEAGEAYARALELATASGDAVEVARAETATAELLRKLGSLDETAAWLERAQAQFERIGDLAGVGQVSQLAGTLAAQRGDYEAARERYEASLALRERLGDRASMGNVLNNLGVVAEYEGDLALAHSFHEQALCIREETGDRLAIAVSLNNLGNIALRQGGTGEARARLEQAVLIQREVGDRWYLANALNNLGNVAREQRDFAAAERLYRESLATSDELGDKWALAYVLEDIGVLASLRGDCQRALQLVAAARSLREEIGAPRPPADQEELERQLEPARQALDEPTRARAWEAGLALPLADAVDAGLATCAAPPGAPTMRLPARTA